MLWTIVIVLAIFVTLIGGYVYWQYRTSRPPALDSIPLYSVGESSVPVTDIPEPQRTDAEAQLRHLASSAQSGYRVADARFRADKGAFIWDAVRHTVGSYLGSAGYGLDNNGWSSDYTIVYSLYRHDGLRRWFNDDMVLVAALDKPIMQTATGDEVHLYGYFTLVPS